MKRYLYLVCFLIFFIEAKARDIKVLQLNIWQETTVVKGGFQGLIDDLISINPDIVLLSEIRNYNEEDFIKKLLQSLQQKGIHYNGFSGLDVGILSKYDILQTETLSDGAGVKGVINVESKNLVVYSLHLDYTHYACYLPRGYNGVTWKKMDGFQADSREIEKANRESKRPSEIKTIIANAKLEKDNLVLIGGDFNEPSHLDWQENTRHLWGHNGAVVNWDCSILLQEEGFVDAYRKINPNPLTHPGFTFPANNKDISVKTLDWAPEADGRDRIDFIYYWENENWDLKDVSIVGPSGSIVFNKRIDKEEGKDKLILPKSVWCTDHRGILGVFDLK